MITRIKYVDIVTLDQSGTVLFDADLVVEDGRITAVGSTPGDLEPDEVIDGRGKVALPGLVNAHCHSPMTLERGLAEDLPFDRWLHERIFPIEQALTPEDVYWGAALAACELIRSGTVAFNDHYFHMDRVLDVVEQSGLKACLSWTLFGLGEDRRITGSDLAGVIDWMRQMPERAGGRVMTYLGPHSPYLCPPEFLETVVHTAEEGGWGIHLHVAETAQQVSESMDTHGKSPVEYLNDLGVFDAAGGAVAAHCLAVDENDMSILAEKGVYVAHCPITYMKLTMPFPPLNSRLGRGVRVALGTDGPASNADMDLFATMRQTALIHKYQAHDPTALPGDSVLRLATCKEALGFEERGSLEVGQPADLILLDQDAPHLRPTHDLVANLVHAAKGADVADVMVEGNWLMRDRELLTLDEENILSEASARARSLRLRAGL